MCPSTFIGPTCAEPVDPCLAFACYNGGTCRTLSGTTFCNCALGFAGPQCEFEDGCRVNCQNGGTCVNNTRCQCPPDWTGIECTVSLNACIPTNPCLNNAICQSTAINTYQCSCLSGFTGSRCETEVATNLNEFFS